PERDRDEEDRPEAEEDQDARELGRVEERHPEVAADRPFLVADHQREDEAAEQAGDEPLHPGLADGRTQFAHAALPSRSPRMPVGRNSRTSTRTTKLMTSVHCAPMKLRLAPRTSASPSSRPPIMAPRMLPIPPSTAAANALTPGVNPIRSPTPKAVPNMNPAAPASAPPITKVREIVLSMSIPIRAAVGASSATARMLRPSFVRFTSRSRKTIMTSAETTMISTINETSALPIVKTRWSRLKYRGKALFCNRLN